MLLKMFTVISLSLMYSSFASEDTHPCKAVLRACREAGYARGMGGQEKKSLLRDCFKPLLEGKTLLQVKVATADLEACQARYDKKKGSK